jgi:choline transport protein
MGSCSRSVWAMGRDRAFPSWMAQINKKWDVPVNATMAIAVPQLLIGLIYIWNSTAFYGVIAGVLVAYQASWLLPISLHLFYGRWNLRLKYGPWNMGRFGWIVDLISVAWTTFVIVVMSLPTFMPTTAENM